MILTSQNYREIVEFFIAEWTKRSDSSLVRSYGRGCFVWNSERDSKTNSSGMFYSMEMLPKYFSPEMAAGLQQMISEANHANEVIVGLIFGEKAVGLRLQKSNNKDAVEVVPAIFH